MDFQTVVDSIDAMTCVVSVEKLPDGGYGDIRIVTGNEAYIGSIEHPAPGAQMLKTTFVPNSLYTDYMTRDLNFEDYCHRAAVHKKCLHSYAHPERMDIWFNMTFLPLQPDNGNTCYCTYTMEINMEPSSERLANVSGGMASFFLEESIKLSNTRDFKATMNEVITDIRELCEADYSGILLVDFQNKTCEMLCESMSDQSQRPPWDERIDNSFFTVAESWKDTIAGSNCFVAKNARDMAVLKERNPLWHDSLVGASVRTIVLFPLKSHNELLGYIWTSNFDPEDAGKIKETLELATVMLGSEIGTYLAVDKLRILGTRDILTGALNRNEMNNVMNKLGTQGSQEKSVGVVFVDLNGLKEVNDSDGHPAGDALLKRATSALRDVFADDEIFRAGGDEFTIIMTDVSEQELNDKIAALEDAAKNYEGVSFAIGGSVESSERDVALALKRADERMYANKKAYYETHSRRREH